MPKCIKLFYNDGSGKNRVVLGVIDSEDDHFFKIKTRSGYIMLNKKNVISMISTREDFIEDEYAGVDKSGKNNREKGEINQ
tara:strand:+ start:278 stop:520 length:243 start_codon:yes stop_codon:yes gene_type:complete